MLKSLAAPWFAVAVLIILPLLGSAQEARLAIERIKIAVGFIGEVVEGSGGGLIVSGDYLPAMIIIVLIILWVTGFGALGRVFMFR